MKLFQYAVIYHPKEVAEENKQSEKHLVIVEPKTVLAKDQNAALMLAARAIPEGYVDKLDQCEVCVRPF